MGAVWLARHTLTKRAVAIKFLKAPASPDLMQRFVREAQAANAVRHPNVVQVHDVFSLDNGLPAMVMDLFEGETLASKLARGPLSLLELGQIMAPVVSALVAIHGAGIVHRDFKPDNIFIAQLPDGSVKPMILDFGICKLDPRSGALGESDVSTTAGRIVGTPCYMAPEQVRGAVDVDARVDIWALGVMLYECATGAPPWDGDSMAQIIAAITSHPVPRIEATAPHLPADVARVINRMLVRDRETRLSDLGEVLAALQGLAKPSTPDWALATAAQSEQSRPQPHPVRAAKTIPRAKVTTLGGGSLSTNAISAPTNLTRSALYFGAIIACLACLGSLFTLLPKKQPGQQGKPPAALAPSILQRTQPTQPAQNVQVPAWSPHKAHSRLAKHIGDPVRALPNFGGRR
jgi:eukaryotic-like serine/threonine-protein kinase